MKKFSLFLCMFNFCCLFSSVQAVNSLGKQAAVAFVQQEGFTLDYLIEWAKDPQNTYIDTLSQEVKQALASAIEKKFRGSLNFLFVRILAGHTDRVTAVACSKSNNFIATGSADTTVKLWRRSTGELLSTFDDSAEITALAFSDDEKLLITCSTVLKIWDLNTGQVKAEFQLNNGHNGHVVHALQISADNRYITIVYKNDNNQEVVWDRVTGQCITQPQQLLGQYIITLHEFHTIQCSDAEAMRILNKYTVKRSHEYNSQNAQETVINYCGNSRYTLTYPEYDDRYRTTEQVWYEIELSHKKTGKMRMLKNLASEPTVIAQCLDKDILVFGSHNTQAKVYSLTTGNILALAGHTELISALALSNNGRYVLTGSHDTTVRVWDIGYLTGQIDFDALMAYVRSINSII